MWFGQPEVAQSWVARWRDFSLFQPLSLSHSLSHSLSLPSFSSFSSLSSLSSLFSLFSLEEKRAGEKREKPEPRRERRECCFVLLEPTWNAVQGTHSHWHGAAEGLREKRALQVFQVSSFLRLRLTGTDTGGRLGVSPAHIGYARPVTGPRPGRPRHGHRFLINLSLSLSLRPAPRPAAARRPGPAPAWRRKKKKRSFSLPPRGAQECRAAADMPWPSSVGRGSQ